jgi:hypothetical protein
MLVKKGIRIESKNSRVYNTEIAISFWRKGIPYAPLLSPEIADQQHVLFLRATTHNHPFAVS